MTDLPLTKLSETTTTITLGWTPPPLCVGYAFYRNGTRVSNTWDPAVKQVKFKKGDSYRVTALGAVAEGVYPSVIPPPPDGWVIAPPVGPFTVLDGGGTQQSFPQAFRRGTDAYNISKLEVRRTTGYGIGSMQFFPPTTDNPGKLTMRDCIAGPVAANPPRSMNGTGEACFWFGSPTDAARFTATDGAWMGVWTGNQCHGSLLEDFTVTGPYVGLYVEHVTRDSTFRRFDIHTVTNTGINIEWWYGGQGSSNLTFEDGKVYCPAGGFPVYGIFADAGTFGCVFRNIEFWGPGNAICLPNKRAGAGTQNLVENCTFNNSGSKVTYHDNNIGS